MVTTAATASSVVRARLRQRGEEPDPQPYRSPGTYLDPTGLYKMGARSYDPNLARFTTTDPSGQENNPYLYAAGDPINQTDPIGLSALTDLFVSSVGVVGGGSGQCG
ncbi:RHS repeat-associated core domain-containing protein [Streptomyces xanthochromogenes]|uniref:RHS repeat-associated core domain-containing protein n=1 Tax=Streptomyces xanthochromogenes TaxID=67384 RepID=UPI003F4D136F